MPANGASVPSLVAFPGLRLVSSCETERVLDLLTDDLLARRNLKADALNKNDDEDTGDSAA